MVELCEDLMEPRRAELRAIHRAESDRRAREQEAAERAAEAEREAERQREREAYRQAERERLRTLEAEARKRFGDDGPLPGDVELAHSLSGQCVKRDWAGQYPGRRRLPRPILGQPNFVG